MPKVVDGSFIKMLNGATATQYSPVFDCIDEVSFQLTGTTSSGGGAATASIEVSNDGTNWLPSALGTLSLTLSTVASSDGFVANTKFLYMRANLSAISGTGASVTLIAAGKNVVITGE